MSSRAYYSPEEDALIRKYYPTATLDRIQELLPTRTARGIRVRACKIGVLKNKECYEIGKPFDDSILQSLTESEKGYIAGILDGEGCLRLSRSKNYLGNPTYHVQVVISNTSKQLMDWLNKKLPMGTAYTNTVPINPSQRMRRVSYNWKVSGNRRAIAFLEEIHPYLVIKREQARLLCNGYVHLPEPERVKLYKELARLKEIQ